MRMPGNKINLTAKRWLLLLLMLLATFSFYSGASDDKVKTPDYYAYNVRSDFKEGRWAAGKQLLDEGIKRYPDAGELSELMGQFYLYHKQYDKSRFFLFKAVQGDKENVRAKQMLVKVEKDTKNYSSAICYVNELLEVNPYWKSLWLEKIGLFRSQGNIIESDRLLTRLYEIYPNDPNIRRRYLGRMEENYVASLKNKDIPHAIKSIQAMIAAEPANPEYHGELVGLYLKEGERDQALAAADRGLIQLPGNSHLARTKVGILAEQHRFGEAIEFVKAYSKTHPGASVANMLNDLEQQAAYDALRNDPYVQFGRVYERQHTKEALDYLLNTSVSRGYDQDALYYIKEAKKHGRREDAKLLYMEYTVYKHMNDLQHAIPKLERAHKLQPNNQDFIAELSAYHLNCANDLMASKQYDEALPHVDYVIRTDTTAETSRAALVKKYVCLTELKRYGYAIALVDSLSGRFSHQDAWQMRKAQILDRVGRTEEGLAILANLALKDKDNLMSGTGQVYGYANDYEEMAIPYIKRLIASGALLKAADATEQLLQINPGSRQGLLYAINTAGALGRTKQYEDYVARGRQLYPDDVQFMIKQASVYNNHKDYVLAMDLLRPKLDSLRGDSALISAYSAAVDMRSLQLMKEHKNIDAIVLLDTALIYDRENRTLLYDKGLAFEAEHMYDSAYYYQKYYRPSLLEVSETKRRLNGLENKQHKNEISLDYMHSRFGEEDVLKGLASVSYTRKEADNTYTGTFNYAGRDGFANTSSTEDYGHGGTGIQLIAQWEHKFSTKWTGTAALGWASRYFPTLQANLKLERSLRNDWTVDLHAGYRRIETNLRTYRLDSTSTEDNKWVFDDWKSGNTNLFNLGVGASKDMWPFNVSGKFDVLALPGHLYFNTSAQGKYFPLNDRISCITAQAGVGTAPEASVLDFGLPGSFSRLNTMVGLGGTYLLTPNLVATVMGTWHTFYNQTNRRTGGIYDYQDTTTTRYKNLFNIYVQLVISF